MRYKKKHIGSRRVIRRFLFLPCEIDDQVRWLEFANIGQHLYDQTNFRNYWSNDKFIDTKEEKLKYLKEEIVQKWY